MDGERAQAPPAPAESEASIPDRAEGESGGPVRSAPKPDDPRRRRGAARRSGFGDGIERAYCLGRGHVPPPEFPVQHRSHVAVRRTVVVSRREDAQLLCDGTHRGAHRWPDGAVVDAP